MNAAVVPLDDVSKVGGDIVSVHEAMNVLDRLATRVQHATIDEAEDAREQTRRIRGLLKLGRAAKSVRIAATRLEFLVYRRIGELDASVLERNERSAAVWLASLSDDQFADVLRTVTINTSPVATWKRTMQGDDNAFRSAARRAAWLNDEEEDRAVPFKPFITEVLARFERERPAFTVKEATDELAVAFCWSDEPAALTALGHMVRQALIHEEVAFLVVESGRVLRIPRFVTTNQDNEVGQKIRNRYERIPWAKSSSWCLLQLADVRDAQAAEISARARDLRDFVSLVDPESTSDLGVMVEAAVRDGRISRDTA